MKKRGDFPGGPVVKTHRLHGTAKKRKKRNEKKKLQLTPQKHKGS